MAVAHYVVAVFDLDEDGALKPGEAREGTRAAAAIRCASLLADVQAGAVAFSRTGDAATGKSEDGAPLAQFGAVDSKALRFERERR